VHVYKNLKNNSGYRKINQLKKIILRTDVKKKKSFVESTYKVLFVYVRAYIWGTSILIFKALLITAPIMVYFR
jgi:hypothetical protein